MFTNRLNAESVGPLFEQIVHGGYRAIVRLCLATLVAHEEQLMACGFETCLLLLQQHLWTQKDVTNKILNSLVSLHMDDDQIDRLETEYATGSVTSTSQPGSSAGGGGAQKGRRGSGRKDKRKKKVAAGEEVSFLGIPGLSRSAATVTGVIAATVFAGMGAMLMLGGGESKGGDAVGGLEKRRSEHNQKRERASK
jgi:hypothetical protein